MSIISKPNTFSPGATIVASEHNDNFNTIYNEFNGNINNANISNSASISYSKLNLSSSIQQSDVSAGLGFFPTGGMIPFGGSSAPAGWLLCDGSAVSRSTYATLFSVISTAYGAGNGTTTFNVPDMRENVPVGYKSGSTQFGTLGGSYGEKTHTLTTTEIPAHTHSMGSAIVKSGGAGTEVSQGNAYAYGYVNATGSAGSDGGHNNIQPSVVFNYIIKT